VAVITSGTVGEACPLAEDQPGLDAVVQCSCSLQGAILQAREWMEAGARERGQARWGMRQYQRRESCRESRGCNVHDGRSGRQPNAGGANTGLRREHLFKCCPHWKRQQELLWAEVRK